MVTISIKILLVAGVLCLSALGANGAENDGPTGSTIPQEDGISCSVAGDDGTSTSPGNDDNKPTQKYDRFWWRDLPEKAREAAAALGYDRFSWNEAEGVLPDVLDVPWQDLSEQQVAAVKVLGWDRSSWNTRYEINMWTACEDWIKVYDEFETIERFDSPYQEIRVFYGEEEDDACLFLDDYIHTCASSRPHYHETFVHYAARFLDQVKRVIYIGGGDSMVLHEVLKYPSLELVVGLELDPEVTRTVFKSFGVQPHWNNEKVQWWYGDAAKSLQLLPREYYGSFDLVIVDITTEVQQNLKVNHELNVIDAAMLLMKPGGIIVKDEDDPYIPGSTSNYTHYSVDLVLQDVPLYCIQNVVFGSNTVDFLTAKPKDHNIETLYLEGVDDFQAQFDSWYNFGMESSRSTLACQQQQNGELTAPDENLEPLGVLMVLEAENTSVPLGSATTVEPAITQALKKVGLVETASMSFPISGSNAGFTLVSLFPAGYVVARCFALLQYCAFDIQLWGAGVAKLDLVKVELVGAVQSQHPSSYRMITGGMSGLQKEEMSRLGPPAAKELCNNQVDDDKTPAEAKIKKERKVKDFEEPRASTLHAYSLSSPRAQWESQRPVGAQALVQFEVPPGDKVLTKDEVSNVLAETLQKIAGSEPLTGKEVSEEIGDGLLMVASWSEGTVLATWDGKTRVEFNLFLSLDDIDSPSEAFDEVQDQTLANWRLTRRDDFPRGIGSVVNFKTDMESPPVWAKE